MWASRGQIQTSADAGALAGAIALAHRRGRRRWPQRRPMPRSRRRRVAQANGVWGAAPDVQPTDVDLPGRARQARLGPPDMCIKVDAFRNQARGNPLGMLFGNLVGVSNQGVRATATAQVIGANTTDCLKPWAVIDRWDEFGPIQTRRPPTGTRRRPRVQLRTSTFDCYSTGKGKAPPAGERHLRAAVGDGGRHRLQPEVRQRHPLRGEDGHEHELHRVSPAGSAPFESRGSTARPAATSTATTSAPAAACPIATPIRPPCARRISPTAMRPTGPSAAAMPPSRATWSGRLVRVSTTWSRSTRTRCGPAAPTAAVINSNQGACVVEEPAGRAHRRDRHQPLHGAGPRRRPTAC